MSQQSSVTAGGRNDGTDGGVETLFELPAQSVPAPSADLRPGGMVPDGGPLAVRMRPRTIDEVAGQAHLLRPGAPLRRLLEGGGAASVLLYGPPGTGKTTIARRWPPPAPGSSSPYRRCPAASRRCAT